MTDLNALAPCPFCGSNFLMGREPFDNAPVGGMFYLFHDYGLLDSPARKCPIDVRRHFETEAEAATAWNTRIAATSQASAKAVREAISCISDLGSGKGGWAWEEVIQQLHEAIDNIEVQAGVETATPSQEPVAVKPLEWKEGKGNFAGQVVWSSGNPWVFWIVKNPDDPSYVWCENFNIEGWCPASPVRGSFPTLELAKAAAQADYEQRIRSALAHPTPAPSCNEALREALEFAAEHHSFEEWASSNMFSMHEHPLHYLFLDPRTDAARQGWKAALKYVKDHIAALSTPAPAQQAWSARTHNEIIKRLMAGVGMPNSTSLYCAFKQFANELHALSTAPGGRDAG